MSEKLYMMDICHFFTTIRLGDLPFLNSILLFLRMYVHVLKGRIMCKCFGSISQFETHFNWKPGLWLVDSLGQPIRGLVYNWLMLPKHLHMIRPLLFLKMYLRCIWIINTTLYCIFAQICFYARQNGSTTSISFRACSVSGFGSLLMSNNACLGNITNNPTYFFILLKQLFTTLRAGSCASVLKA